MRYLKFAVVLAFFGLIAVMGLYQSSLTSVEAMTLEQEKDQKARFSFVLEGAVDNGRYSYVAVADTLNMYFAENGPAPVADLNWDFELMERNPFDGKTLDGTVENFRLRAEMEFPSRTDRLAWMNKLLSSSHLKRTPSPTDAEPGGKAELRLPLADGSGGWLILPELHYRFSLS
jgi:hypothetical protein